MKRALLLGAIFVILLPQLLLSDQSLDYCCGRQLGTRNLGLAFASGYVDVSVSQAKQMIDSNPSLVILDVRTLEEYESGHIKNATLIPVDELAGRLDELSKDDVILVYCKAGGRSATGSQILVDNGFSKVYNMLGGITAWSDAGYWIEIIHEGDLIIDGTQNLLIQHCSYIQAGNIFVKDHGELVLRNTGLHMLQTTAFSPEILFEGYGTLEMRNAILTSDKPLVINFTQASKASFNNVTVDAPGLSGLWFDDFSETDINQSIFPGQSGIRFYKKSKGSISHSTIRGMTVNWEAHVRTFNINITGSLEMCFLHGLNHVEVKNLQPGYHEYLDAQELVDGLQIDLMLNKTFVNRWAVVAYCDSETVISNSIVQLGIWVKGGISVQLGYLKPAFYSYLDVGQIVLNSTDVTDQVYVFIEDSTVHFSDSEIFLDLGFNSSVYLTNSVIDGLNCNPWKFYGVLHFENASWLDYGPLTVADSDFLIQGDVAFGHINVALWQSTNITRNYTVISRNMNSSSLEGVELTLLDQNDNIVWRGLTDSQGLANFDVTFSNDNYTETLGLKTLKEGFYNAAEQQINFSSNTPISITLVQKRLGDVNEDHVVNILDISLAAIAFGSNMGDPNWNQATDLNEDGVINILDISLIAKEYGMTA